MHMVLLLCNIGVFLLCNWECSRVVACGGVEQFERGGILQARASYKMYQAPSDEWIDMLQ